MDGHHYHPLDRHVEKRLEFEDSFDAGDYFHTLIETARLKLADFVLYARNQGNDSYDIVRLIQNDMRYGSQRLPKIAEIGLRPAKAPEIFYLVEHLGANYRSAVNVVYSKTMSEEEQPPRVIAPRALTQVTHQLLSAHKVIILDTTTSSPRLTNLPGGWRELAERTHEAIFYPEDVTPKPAPEVQPPA